MREIYFEVRTEDIAYVKFVIESYEGVGLIRTVLRQAQHGERSRTIDRKKAVIVFLVVEDFLPVARGLVAALHDEIQLREIPRPPDVGDDWLMNELAADNNSRVED